MDSLSDSKSLPKSPESVALSNCSAPADCDCESAVASTAVSDVDAAVDLAFWKSFSSDIVVVDYRPGS